MSSSSKDTPPASPNKRVFKPHTTRATARTSVEPSHARESRATIPPPEPSIDKDCQDKDEDNNLGAKILESELDDHVTKAFHGIGTLTDARVDKVIHMLKLAIAHDRDKASSYKKRRAFYEAQIKELEETMKYESTLSPEDKTRYHERKLQEARDRCTNAEVANSHLQKEKAELEFKLSLPKGGARPREGVEEDQGYLRERGGIEPLGAHGGSLRGELP